MYLKAYRNSIMHTFNIQLHEMLNGLMSVYRKLNPKIFMSTKNVLEAFQYVINLPVDVVFDPIDDLAELSEVARQPMMEAQKVNLALIILQNTGKFTSDLKKLDS